MRLEFEDQTRPEGCLQASELERQVESRLSRRVFTSSSSAELTLALRVRRVGATWSAELRLSDSAGVLGQRELRSRGKHCSSLDDSLALVVALLVDTPTTPPSPESAADAEPSREPPAPASTRPTRTQPGAPRTTPILLPPETPARREPWVWGGQAALTLGAGLLPGLARGAEVAVSATPPRAPEIRLSMEFSWADRASVASRDAGARFFLGRAGLELCHELTANASLGLEACMGQRVGRLSVEGYGFDQNSTRARLLHTLNAGAGGVLRLSQMLKLVVTGQLELPLQREKFVWRTEDDVTETVFQQRWLGAGLKIGVRWAP